jgi:hypothetical protein
MRRMNQVTLRMRVAMEEFESRGKYECQERVLRFGI